MTKEKYALTTTFPSPLSMTDKRSECATRDF